MLMNNASPGGSIEVDKFQRAMLVYQNSVDPETMASPAMIVIGHPIRDPIPMGRGIQRAGSCKVLLAGTRKMGENTPILCHLCKWATMFTCKTCLETTQSAENTQEPLFRSDSTTNMW